MHRECSRRAGQGAGDCHGRARACGARGADCAVWRACGVRGAELRRVGSRRCGLAPRPAGCGPGSGRHPHGRGSRQLHPARLVFVSWWSAQVGGVRVMWPRGTCLAARTTIVATSAPMIASPQPSTVFRNLTAMLCGADARESPETQATPPRHCRHCQYAPPPRYR